jgi:hypothetical protein
VPDATETEQLDTWAVVEAMGHRTLIGRLTEVTLAGTPMLRLERIDGKGAHEFPASAIYMLTRCTEAQARVAQARYYGYGVPDAITAALGGDDEDDEVTNRDVDPDACDRADSNDFDDSEPF